MELCQLSLLCKLQYLNATQFKGLQELADSALWHQIAEWKQLEPEAISEGQARLEAELKKLADEDILYPGHPEYPAEFTHISAPPVFLTYHGSLDLLKGRKVSVIGGRQPLPRFLDWMDTHLSDFLAETPATVVSGGAMGVDQRASSLALLHGRPTVILLPSGLATPYPKILSDWKSRENILFLSEYLPDEFMFRHHFILRNRLITALGAFLLVVQAAIKSGSMMSVNYAIAQNKDVATLPDFPGLEVSSGNLRLIKEGCHVVTVAADLRALFDAAFYRENQLRFTESNGVAKPTV